MLKGLFQSCKRYPARQLELTKKKVLLSNLIKRSAFFSFKNEEPQKNTQEDEISSLKNISHLIKQIKEQNKKLPPLLPQKDIKDQDKLTVVMEMDEVLLYIFYPDEHEGYLQSPLR